MSEDKNVTNIEKTFPAELILSQVERDAIKINSEELKVLEKDKKIIEVKNQLITIQNALLDAQREVVKRDQMILEYHTLQLNEKLQKMKDRNRDELVEISRNYEGLNGKKWGYNPETGEIVINEEIQTTP